jgi:hypothetical protein
VRCISSITTGKSRRSNSATSEKLLFEVSF